MNHVKIVFAISAILNALTIIMCVFASITVFKATGFSHPLLYAVFCLGAVNAQFFYDNVKRYKSA